MNKINCKNVGNIIPHNKILSESETDNKYIILEEYLNETKLAEHWKVSTKLLQKMRYQGGGPNFVKIGSLVRYPRSEIIKYEQNNKRSNTCELGVL